VSAIGLGCMPMVGQGAVHYGPANEAEAIATIHRAIEIGVTFFDTAEVCLGRLREIQRERAYERSGMMVSPVV